LDVKSKKTATQKGILKRNFIFKQKIIKFFLLFFKGKEFSWARTVNFLPGALASIFFLVTVSCSLSHSIIFLFWLMADGDSVY
jgi:hypothetical protein